MGCEYGYFYKVFGFFFVFIYMWMCIGVVEFCIIVVFVKVFVSYIVDLIGDDCGLLVIFYKLLVILVICKLFKS